MLSLLRAEQKKRNRSVNRSVENTLGFAHSGSDASYANFFAAMIYDLHLLGDYEPDNQDLDGLVEFNTLVNGILSTINRLDARNGKPINRDVNRILKSNNETKKKAEDIVNILKVELPIFISKAKDGYIKRRLKSNGIKFMQ